MDHRVSFFISCYTWVPWHPCRVNLLLPVSIINLSRLVSISLLGDLRGYSMLLFSLFPLFPDKKVFAPWPVCEQRAFVTFLVTKPMMRILSWTVFPQVRSSSISIFDFLVFAAMVDMERLCLAPPANYVVIFKMAALQIFCACYGRDDIVAPPMQCSTEVETKLFSVDRLLLTAPLMFPS